MDDGVGKKKSGLEDGKPERKPAALRFPFLVFSGMYRDFCEKRGGTESFAPIPFQMIPDVFLTPDKDGSIFL